MRSPAYRTASCRANRLQYPGSHHLPNHQSDDRVASDSGCEFAWSTEGHCNWFVVYLDDYERRMRGPETSCWGQYKDSVGSTAERGSYWTGLGRGLHDDPDGRLWFALASC